MSTKSVLNKIIQIAFQLSGSKKQIENMFGNQLQLKILGGFTYFFSDKKKYVEFKNYKLFAFGTFQTGILCFGIRRASFSDIA